MSRKQVQSQPLENTNSRALKDSQRDRDRHHFKNKIESDKTVGRQKSTPLSNSNVRNAKAIWGVSSKFALRVLLAICNQHQLSIEAGDLQLLNGRWYITHSGLLRIAHRRRCAGICTNLQKSLSDVVGNRWVFKATVYRNPKSKGFVAYGDADPSNVSSLVRGAELRIAETRAVNRALRKAYGIGLCSVEELGAFSGPPRSGTFPSQSSGSPSSNGAHGSNGGGNGQPRLRDQLCLLIRQHNLDSNLVKAYAADFCGTEALSGASRELVESFISHLSAAAKENRDALVCKLNSYSQPVEAKS
jgi:hypothetical protein